MLRSWMPFLRLWGYGSLALIVAGNILAQMTFLHMSWQVDVPGVPRHQTLSRIWITRKRAQQVLSSFRQAHPESRVPFFNKLGGIGAMTGLGGTITWVITMCLLIVHLKG